MLFAIKSLILHCRFLLLTFATIITDIIMGNLLDSLKDYFDKTPQDVLEKDFKELEYLNEIGPDAIAYVEYVKGNFDIEMSCSHRS